VSAVSNLSGLRPDHSSAMLASEVRVRRRLLPPDDLPAWRDMRPSNPVLRSPWLPGCLLGIRRVRTSKAGAVGHDLSQPLRPNQDREDTCTS
jgi:hypothetical protein